ncbi:hypothetical protein L9F63_010174, partial [Diploptera punctata]
SEFYKLENSLMIEVHSSCSKTLTHCFPNILQHLVALASHLLLHRTEKMWHEQCISEFNDSAMLWYKRIHH